MDIATIISAVAAVCGIVFGLVIFFRNKRSDDTQDGKKDGVVLTELGYIKSGVDDIKQQAGEAGTTAHRSYFATDSG